MAALRILARIVPLLLFLGLWQVAVVTGLVDSAFLPPVDAIGRALADLLRDRGTAWDLGVSLVAAFGGLGLAIVAGVPLGAAMATSKMTESFFGPLIKATYSLPKSALVPLLILWLGIGIATNMVTVVLASLLPIVVYTYHGVQSVPAPILWGALSMGTRRHQIFTRILLPAALHEILTGVRIALGFSFVLTITAEMIAARAGIGKLMFTYGENGVYDYMFAAVALIVLVAYLADRELVALTGHLLRWREPAEHHG